MRVLVSGGTGFVGSAVVPGLRQQGHAAVLLSRRAGADRIIWDPAASRLDPEKVEGCQGVVHLAGENIAGRWTENKKRRIRESRVQGTRILAQACAAARHPPQVFVLASAIGFYGDRGEEILTEESSRGELFLSDVAMEWEAATQPLETAGVRVVKLRLGVVLGPGGGAVDKMLIPFRLGLGGPIGTGQQWMSWIDMQDVVGLVLRALEEETMSGVYNAVAPQPGRNREFTRALGRAVHRPALLPVPPLALRLVYKEMADEALLVSQRVIPQRLEQEGYTFRVPDLQGSLGKAVGR